MATLMFEQGNGVDLSRLNEAERQVLRLLAEGHTAKSVANEIGSTPASVNERLREARRKTGAGSSRELARMLKSQEIRHDEIGVGGARDPGFQLRGAVPVRRNWKGVVVLAIVILTAVGVALTFAPTENSGTQDPIYGDVLAERDPDKIFEGVKSKEEVESILIGEGSNALLRRRRATLESEARDPDWAPATEDGLRAAFSAIPHIGVKTAELRVQCAKTLCEVVGTIDTSFATDEAKIFEELNRSTSKRLNPHAMQDEFAKLKVKTAGWVQSSTKDQPSKPMFLAYFAREK